MLVVPEALLRAEAEAVEVGMFGVAVGKRRGVPVTDEEALLTAVALAPPAPTSEALARLERVEQKLA